MRLFSLQWRSFCLRSIFFTYGGGTVIGQKLKGRLLKGSFDKACALTCRSLLIFMGAGIFLNWLPFLGGRELNTNFFLKLFRHPRDNPAKVPGYPANKFVFPGFRRTYRTFWPPPLNAEDPHPTRRYPDPKKFGFGFLFLPWFSKKKKKKGGLPLPLGRGVCETKSKKGRARDKKPFIHRVYSTRRGIETMVSDHGLGRRQTMG